MGSEKQVSAKLLLVALFVTVVVCLRCSRIVYADSFFPVGNIEQSQLSYVVGIGITELGNRSVTYNENAIKGVFSDRLRDYTFATISSNPLLKSQLESGIAAPAGSLLSVFWFPSNATGHDVYVHNSWLFAHDLRTLGLSPVIYRSLLYYSEGRSANQVGECLQLGALGTIPFSIEVRGKRLFDFTIPQPIRIEQRDVVLSADSIGGNYKYRMTIANESDLDESVAVAGIDRTIVAHEAIFIEGSVNYYHELPRVMSLKGREIGCFRGSGQSNLLAISRNDVPANWFWGGIQFDNSGINSMGNYCVVRVDSDIAVDWGDSVDFEGTVSASVVAENVITPPETVYLELVVTRGGGVRSTSVVTELELNPQISSYYQGSSDAFRNEGSKVVFVSDMLPDSSKIIVLKFVFPDKLPVEYYEQASTLSYSVNGSSVKTVSFDFKLTNMQNIEITPLENWCVQRKYQVTIENEGNAVIIENSVPIYVAEYTTVEVFDNSGAIVIARYEFIKGEYIIKIPGNSIIKFNTSNLGGTTIGRKQLEIPKCHASKDIKNSRKPIHGSYPPLTPTVKKVIEDTLQQVEEHSVSGAKNSNAAATDVVTAGLYRVFGQLFLSLIVISAVIGAIRYAQSYFKVVPKKR